MKNITITFLSSLLFLSVFFSGCAQIDDRSISDCRTHFIRPSFYPSHPIFDDLDYQSLESSLEESIVFLQSQPQEEKISACGREITVSKQLETLSTFREILSSPANRSLHGQLLDSFEICEVLNSRGKPELLATGYFQPRFKASSIFDPPFIYPIYSKPSDLVETAEEVNGKAVYTVGREDNGVIVPYWTREEIETQGKLRGNELLYLSDPVEAFILHVQGSGLAELKDGSVVQVLYNGSNGRPYSSIGRLLVDEGHLSLSEVSLPTIRSFLQEHLDDRQRILHYNERYIFFRTASAPQNSGPIGSMGKPLTAERSIALDNQCFPIGGLYFMESTAPVFSSSQKLIGWEPFSQFVLHQDTGAAIKGSGRIDYFWGSGDYARAAAGLMKQPARLYMIVSK